VPAVPFRRGLQLELIRQTEIACERLLARSDLGDLRSLKANAAHQTLLAEDESIDIGTQIGRCERPRGALVKHDDTRPGTDRPAAAVVEVGQRRVRHEEQGVAKFLYPSLEPIGGGTGSVIADGLGPFSERPVTVLCTDDESRLFDIGEDANRFGLCPQRFRAFIVRIKFP